MNNITIKDCKAATHRSNVDTYNILVIKKKKKSILDKLKILNQGIMRLLEIKFIKEIPYLKAKFIKEIQYLNEYERYPRKNDKKRVCVDYSNLKLFHHRGFFFVSSNPLVNRCKSPLLI